LGLIQSNGTPASCWQWTLPASKQSLSSLDFHSIFKDFHVYFRAIALIAAKMDGVPSEKQFIFITLIWKNF
jgi:hypothetical protein